VARDEIEFDTPGLDANSFLCSHSSLMQNAEKEVTARESHASE